MSLERSPLSLNRIEIIDVLRGFTLFGIVLIHMVEQYYAGPTPEKYRDITNQYVSDPIIGGFVGIFILGKFYMIFSFLFGLSFYIQLSKAEGSLAFLTRFAWRLVILFMIGLLHHIHYRGDILTIYAMLGFGLFLFYRVPDRYLALLGLFLILNIPSLITRSINIIWPNGSGNPFDNQNVEEQLHYYNTFKSGPYLELLKENFYDFKDKMDFQIWSGRIYITFGLFLMGLYAGRKKFFEQPSQYLPWIKRMIKLSYWVILSCFIVAAIFFGASGAMGIQHSPDMQWLVGGSIFDIFNTALAFLYVGWIIQLFQKSKWHKRLMIFYAPGRMGLTTYLLQSVFGLFIFSCVGLRLLGLSNTVSFALAILFFIVQIVFSKWWLSKFQYGFFEWLWRSLTNFKRAKFIKDKRNPSNTVLQADRNY